MITVRTRGLKRTLLALAVFGSPVAFGHADDGPAPPRAEAAVQGLRAKDVELRRKAAAALRDSEKGVRRDALPVLIELLRGEKDGQVRLAVLDTVTSLGPDAAPAVPALVYTLETDYGGQAKEEQHQDYRSALALAAVGKPAVEGLRGLLSRRKVNVRAESAMALGRIGPDAAPAVPDLIRLLGDASDRVAQEASLALGRIGAAAAGPLTDACADQRAPVRARAVEALGRLSPAADRVRETVLGRVRDDASSAVRAAGLRALAKLNVPEDVLVPVLGKSLADADEGVRLAALNLLVGRRDLLPGMVPRLKELLTNGHEGVARHAAFLLRTVGPDAAPTLLGALTEEGARVDQIAAELAQIGRPIVGLLTRSLQAPEPRVRRGAALALGQIRPLPADAVKTLTAGLNDPDPEVRGAFLAAIGHLGPREKGALSAVRARLKDESPEIRRQAIDVLSRSAPRDDQLVSDLTALLDDADPRVQCRALQVVRSLGPLSRAAVPAATAKLGSPDLDVRLAAAELIGSHGPTAAAAVPALTSMLDDPTPEARTCAAQTLGKMGKAAQPALPRLVALLRGQPAAIRAEVALALGSLELDAEAVRPHLAEALGADEADVRRAALRSIQRLGPQAVLFVPDIILLAARQDERRSIERTLRRFERSGPDPRSVPDLVERLGHEQETVRLLAVKFLSLAGPNAKDALPALERLSNDPSAEVRRQAEVACTRIKGEPGSGQPGQPDSQTK